MLIPIVLFSCNKKESVTQTHSNMDTVTQQISAEHSNVKDTLNKPVEIIQQNGRQGMMREMEGFGLFFFDVAGPFGFVKLFMIIFKKQFIIIIQTFMKTKASLIVIDIISRCQISPIDEGCS